MQGEKTNDKPNGYISQYYQSNIDIINELFGTTCTISDYDCRDDSNRVYAAPNGIVAFTNDDGGTDYFACGVESDGSSYCE